MQNSTDVSTAAITGNRGISMIRTDSEYKEALKRLEQDTAVIAQQVKNLEAIGGLTQQEIDRVIQPTLCFHAQLKEEVETYEKLKKGEIPDPGKGDDK